MPTVVTSYEFFRFVLPDDAVTELAPGEKEVDLSTVPTGADLAAVQADATTAIADAATAQADATAALAGAVQTYVSQTITEADLTAGPTCTVALTGEPVGIIPIAAYIVTNGGPVIGTVDTTGLDVTVAAADGTTYVALATNVFGAAGRKSGAIGAGSAQGSYRSNDALTVTFAAVGIGAEDCADITGLSMRVVVKYLPVSAEF